MTASTRRGLLARLTNLIAAILGIGMGVPLLTVAIQPALRKKESPWADAGFLSELAPGTPQDLSYVATTMARRTADMMSETETDQLRMM